MTVLLVVAVVVWFVFLRGREPAPERRSHSAVALSIVRLEHELWPELYPVVDYDYVRVIRRAELERIGGFGAGKADGAPGAFPVRVLRRARGAARVTVSAAGRRE